MVRREAVIALSKFVSQPVHNECIKIVVTELRALVLSQVCLYACVCVLVCLCACV